MRREIAELVGSGLLVVVLLGSSVAVLAAGGASAAPPARSAASAAARSAASAPAPGETATATEQGRTLFLTKGCNGCHPMAGAPGTFGIGPNLTDLAQVADTRRAGMSAEVYVRESILAPQAFIAPGFGRGPVEQMPQLPVDDAELEALVRLLLTPRAAP